MNLQLTIITKSIALASKDPYFYLMNIYYLLDNQTIWPEIKYYYLPGNIIFCSAALQIFKDYIIAYYFLKFGGIYFLFLFILNIFYFTLKIFRKISIAFTCSLLLLSFYLYIFGLNGFYSSSVAIYFSSCFLIIFFKNKKFLYYLGFLIPLLFFYNPPVLFFNGILFICFILLNLFIFNRKDYLEYIKITSLCTFLILLLFIPYCLFLLYLGSNIFELFITYANSTISTNLLLTLLQPFGDTILYFMNVKASNLGIVYTQNIWGNIIAYLLSPGYSIAFITILLFLILTGLGFLYNPINKKRKSIGLVCKLAILIIIISYIMTILFLHSTQFFSTFQDRIFAIFCPYIIILCGFGIQNLNNTIKKIIGYFNQKYSGKIKLLKKNRILKKLFKPELFLLLLLNIAIITINFAQFELIDRFTHYEFDDYTVKSYLYLREESSKNSIIMTPKFEFDQLLDWMLYDMRIMKYQFNMETTFNEIHYFVRNNKINYVLLKKSELNPYVLYEFSINDKYDLLMENLLYYIYEVN